MRPGRGRERKIGGKAVRRYGGKARREVIVVPSCVKMIGRSARLAALCHPERSEGSGGRTFTRDVRLHPGKARLGVSKDYARVKKIAMTNSVNPEWNDLAEL
ncbi:MAG: hypothetical protein H0T58_01260 [Gemmatimonadales bacterium]|nr:hypothetical protein [Gemmatimonadales bacterium]